MIIFEIGIYTLCALWIITGAITHNLAVVVAMFAIVCACAWAGARYPTPPAE